MTKEIRFKKLYCIAQEGYDANAIIIYSKRPQVAEIQYENGKSMEVIVQWRKVLILDLWLVTIRFDWFTSKKIINS